MASDVGLLRRVPVSVPDGCLLVQAGKQLERLTGGHVLAGFHEVRPAGLVHGEMERFRRAWSRCRSSLSTARGIAVAMVDCLADEVAREICCAAFVYFVLSLSTRSVCRDAGVAPCT